MDDLERKEIKERQEQDVRSRIAQHRVITLLDRRDSVPAVRFSCAKAFYLPDRPIMKEHFLYARAESETNGILEYWIMDKGSIIEIIISLSVAQTSPADNIQTFINLLKIAEA